MDNENSQLNTLAKLFIANQDDFGQIFKISAQYYTLLIEVSKFDDASIKNRNDIYTKNGKVLNSFGAAYCIKDFVRTHRFIKGLHLAIQTLLKKTPTLPLKILYAGSGPFATLALPMTQFFSPEQIHFTCLEINEESAITSINVIRKFGLTSFFDDVLHIDAMQYEPKDQSTFDIILTETMQTALQKESQVDITIHLRDFLQPKGIWLPNQINVTAVLINPVLERAYLQHFSEFLESDFTFELGDVFRIGAEGLFPDLILDSKSKIESFAQIDIEIPSTLSTEFSNLYLHTTVHVYADQFIYPRQSGITLPTFIYNRNVTNFKKVNFRYLRGNDPKFIFGFEK